VSHLGHRAIAIPDLEAVIRALRLNRRRNFVSKKVLRTMSISEPLFVVPMPGRRSRL
jgi:hypothetical protein